MSGARARHGAGFGLFPPCVVPVGGDAALRSAAAAGAGTEEVRAGKTRRAAETVCGAFVAALASGLYCEGFLFRNPFW